MFSLEYILFAALVSAAFFLWQWRRREIFRVEVNEGRARLVRGRMPPGMLSEMAEVMASPPVRRATIFAVRGLSGAQVYCDGDLDAGREQRLRNIFALYPTSHLRSPEEPERSVGEKLWLMLRWLLGR
jgi:hypothetical protein